MTTTRLEISFVQNQINGRSRLLLTGSIPSFCAAAAAAAICIPRLPSVETLNCGQGDIRRRRRRCRRLVLSIRIATSEGLGYLRRFPMDDSIDSDRNIPPPNSPFVWIQFKNKASEWLDSSFALSDSSTSSFSAFSTASCISSLFMFPIMRYHQRFPEEQHLFEVKVALVTSTAINIPNCGHTQTKILSILPERLATVHLLTHFQFLLKTQNLPRFTIRHIRHKNSKIQNNDTVQGVTVGVTRKREKLRLWVSDPYCAV
ncbi:hypothetical protein T06_12576 [Trichinella sp. T6]|nr:hypothetical protein T06_12576 [Trichinella sp. T6]